MAFIYVLVDPRTKEIRYVGRTVQKLSTRLKGHIHSRDVSYRTSWVKSLRALGLHPNINLVQEVPDSVAPEAEIYWISYFNSIGCPLTNLTEGGAGGMRGYHHTEETKSRMSNARLGKRRPDNSVLMKKRWETWRVEVGSFPPEVGKKISEAKKGTRRTEGFKDQLSTRMAGVPKSKIVRARISASHKGKVLSSEHRAKIGASKRGLQLSESHKHKIAEGNKGKKVTIKQRYNISVAAKKRWARRANSSD